MPCKPQEAGKTNKPQRGILRVTCEVLCYSSQYLFFPGFPGVIQKARSAIHQAEISAEQDAQQQKHWKWQCHLEAEKILSLHARDLLDAQTKSLLLSSCQSFQCGRKCGEDQKEKENESNNPIIQMQPRMILRHFLPLRVKYTRMRHFQECASTFQKPGCISALWFPLLWHLLRGRSWACYSVMKVNSSWLG